MLGPGRCSSLHLVADVPKRGLSETREPLALSREGCNVPPPSSRVDVLPCAPSVRGAHLRRARTLGAVGVDEVEEIELGICPVELAEPEQDAAVPGEVDHPLQVRVTAGCYLFEDSRAAGACKEALLISPQ